MRSTQEEKESKKIKSGEQEKRMERLKKKAEEKYRKRKGEKEGGRTEEEEVCKRRKREDGKKREGGERGGREEYEGRKREGSNGRTCDGDYSFCCREAVIARRMCQSEGRGGGILQHTFSAPQHHLQPVLETCYKYVCSRAKRVK